MNLRAVVALLFVASVVTPSARAQEVDYVLDPPEPRVGDIVRFTISLTGGARTGSAIFAGKKVPGFQTGGLLNVYFGVDLDVQPGSHDLVYEMPGIKETVRGTVTVPVKARELATESLEVEEKYPALDEASQQRADREAKELEAIWSVASPQRLWAKAFVRPAAGALGSPFGLRRTFDGEPRSPHSGLDIKAPLGAEVYAANAGKVVLAKELFFTGNTVIVDHGLGLYTVYAHLARIDVATGDEVERAKVIGLVGATGRVTGPNLHWAASIVGARVDPATLPGMTP